jgi:hypothetical protein
MVKEDSDWENIVAEFEEAPARGIRGAAGLKRKSIYILQDQNLQELYANINQKDPLVYLRSISHHL